MNSVIKRVYYNYKIPNLGYRGVHTSIHCPFLVTVPKNVFIYEFAGINPYATFITNKGKIVIRKFSILAFGVTIVTHNHVPVVGIPNYLNCSEHINDIEGDIIIEEDVWIGANATLLYGAHIGRGSIVGACALVNEGIPPYAVVVGVPSKIIGVKFSIDNIIEHEKRIYKEEERFSREYLEDLFKTFYEGKKVFYDKNCDDISVKGKWDHIKLEYPDLNI